MKASVPETCFACRHAMVIVLGLCRTSFVIF